MSVATGRGTPLRDGDTNPGCRWLHGPGPVSGFEGGGGNGGTLQAGAAIVPYFAHFPRIAVTVASS